jgi:hypothetical protein
VGFEMKYSRSCVPAKVSKLVGLKIGGRVSPTNLRKMVNSYYILRIQVLKKKITVNRGCKDTPIDCIASWWKDIGYEVEIW